MASSYVNNKTSIYNYRRTHVDKVREVNRRAGQRHRSWCAIQRAFLRILSDM